MATPDKRQIKTARDLMSSPAITVAPETPVQDLARILRESHISGVPVVDANGAVLGTITEVDMIARNAPLQQPGYIPVLSGVIPIGRGFDEYREQMRQILATNAGELMSDDEPTVVSPDTELGELFRLMQKPEIALLSVVESEQIVGVVTRTDLMLLIEELELELAERDDNHDDNGSAG